MLTTMMAALLLAAAPAQQEADTTFNVDARGRLLVEDIRGDVSIHTWDRPQIRVAIDRDDRQRLRIDAGGPNVRIGFDRFRGNAGADLHLTIPSAMAIRITGTQGDIQVNGVQGEVSIEVVNGSIELTGGRGLVTLHSVNGDIQAHNVQGRMDLNTTSGDMEASGLSGDLVAQTISGDIHLTSVDANSAQVSTVSGDVTYDGSVHERGSYSLKAHSGDVTLVAPQPMNATIAVNTFSGDFETDIPLRLNEQQGGKRFSFTLGTGSAHVELESFSGDIRLSHDRAPAKAEH